MPAKPRRATTATAGCGLKSKKLCQSPGAVLSRTRSSAYQASILGQSRSLHGEGNPEHPLLARPEHLDADDNAREVFPSIPDPAGAAMLSKRMGDPESRPIGSVGGRPATSAQ